MKLINTKVIPILLVVVLWGLGVRNGNGNVLFRGQPQWVLLDGNNIRAHIWDTGVFDQDPTTNNTPGFEWPKGSGKFAIFTAGLTVATYINGELRMAANSYTGELGPGFINGGVPTTSPDFKIYRINDWDNCQSNPDYANWGLMVPYGAPYYDINHNGAYDDCIDKPGIRFARQTIFVAMTDGFPANHTSSEGFGGGTAPINADFRMTAWCYNNFSGLEDGQFVKWEIINQNNIKWDSTFFAIVSDVDLGDATDDYIGCDTNKNLAYCYNSDNQDGTGSGATYGANPPAVGIQYLRTPLLNSFQLGMTSFSYFTNPGSGQAPCERDPINQTEAYNYLNGLKTDGTPWLNPETTPAFKTKFCYPGLPGGPGWNESMGRINNCGGDTTGTLVPSPGGDRRIIISSGSSQLTINPGDTQTVVIGQHISRGTNYLNSVTKLLSSSQSYKYLFDNDFDFTVSGTIRYSDNNTPVTGGYVKALRVDGNTGQVLTLDSASINTNGTYSLTKVPYMELDIMAYPSSEIEDFVPTYYPSTTRWQEAISLTPDSNMTGVDVNVIRTTPPSLSPVKAFIKGKVSGDSTLNILGNAIAYLKMGSDYYSYNISNDSGKYIIQPPALGTYQVFVDRLGFSSDSILVNIQSLDSVYEVNFNLHQQYVGIINNLGNLPDGYSLFQNYPNPFNPSTKIKFQIPEGGLVRLVIYDMTGREIKTLVNGTLSRGEYTFDFIADNLPSGVYFYALTTKNYHETKKMVLLK